VAKVSAAGIYCVGLTGGIGSGKSTVANLLAVHGASLIDADVIAHALTGAGGEAIPMVREAFGDEAVEASGAMNRAYIRTLVFADPQARERLEAIVHPLVRTEVERQLATASGPYALLVVPLLVESAYYRERCDRVVVVECAENVRIQRVRERNGLSEEQVRRIIAAQASAEERRAVADDLIDNGGSLAELAVLLETLHQRLLMLAGQKYRGELVL